jgi:hypothetical protein
MSPGDHIEALLERYELAERAIPDRLPASAPELEELIQSLTTIEQAFSEELADVFGRSHGPGIWKTSLWNTVVPDRLSEDRLQRALGLRKQLFSRRSAAKSFLENLVNTETEMVLGRYEGPISEPFPSDLETLREVNKWIITAKQSFPEELADAIGHNRQKEGWKLALWHSAALNKLSQERSARVHHLKRSIDAFERDVKVALADARADTVFTKFERITSREPLGGPDVSQQFGTTSEQVGSWYVATKQAFLEDLAGAIGHNRQTGTRESSFWKAVGHQLSAAQAQHARLVLEQLSDTCAEIVFKKYEMPISEPLPGNVQSLREVNEWIITAKRTFPEELADVIGHNRQTKDWKSALWSAVSNALSEGGSQRAGRLRRSIDSFEWDAKVALGNARADIVFAKFERITSSGPLGSRNVSQQFSTTLERVLSWYVATKQAFLEDLADAIGHNRQTRTWESTLWEAVRRRLSAAQAQHARLVVQQLRDACAEIVFKKYENPISEPLPSNVQSLREVNEWIITAKRIFPEELADVIGHNRQTKDWKTKLWRSAVPSALSEKESQRASRLSRSIDGFEWDAKVALADARADIVFAKFERITQSGPLGSRDVSQ